MSIQWIMPSSSQFQLYAEVNLVVLAEDGVGKQSYSSLPQRVSFPPLFWMKSGFPFRVQMRKIHWNLCECLASKAKDKYNLSCHHFSFLFCGKMKMQNKRKILKNEWRTISIFFHISSIRAAFNISNNISLPTLMYVLALLLQCYTATQRSVQLFPYARILELVEYRIHIHIASPCHS